MIIATRIRLLGTLIVLACCALSFAAVTPSVPVFAAEGLGKGEVNLDGPWQFHTGDNLAWASADIDDATGNSGWEQIAADKPWGAQGHPAYTGFAWYRKHIHAAPAPGAEQQFAMLIKRVEDPYEIYWNGVLVGRNGKLPPNPSWYFSQAAQTFGLGEVRDGVLALRVWKAPLTSFDSDQLGGVLAPPMLGSPTAIAAKKAELDYAWLHGRQYTFGIVSLYGLVALLSFLSWMRDRSQRVLLWMAVFSSAPLCFLFLLNMRLPLSYTFALGVAQPVFSQQDIGLWFVLLYLLKLNENPRLARLTRNLAILSLTGTVLDGALTFLDWSQPGLMGWAQLADGILTAVFTVLQIYPLVLVALGLRKRLDSTRWMVAICAFFSGMISVVRVAVQQGSRFTHWTLGDKIAAPLFTVNGNPFTLQVIANTLLLLAIIYAVYRYSKDATRRQTEMEQELKSAREVQQVLFPEALPPLPGYAVTSAYRPAQEVGGDFFQIIPIESEEQDSALVVLGDVSGKGLKAAMAVSLIVGSLRTLAEYSSSPAEILNGLNRRLYGRLRGGFATCVVLRLHSDGSCVMANAGHPSPFINKQEVSFNGALPLGVVADSVYVESKVQLAVDDHIVIYTDGLLEARTPTGELFSFERLSKLMAERPNAEQATNVAQGFGQQDDITVLTFTRLAAGAESTTHLIAPLLAPAA